MPPLSGSIPASQIRRPDAVFFDVPDFDAAVAEKGVRLIHWRAMRCPVGMVDLRDNRRPLHDHEGCSNGYIYTKAGSVVSLFTGNSQNMKPSEAGILDGAIAMVTLPRHYEQEEGCHDDLEEVQVAAFDRFFLDEDNITVTYWQLFEAHASGSERLQFPVVAVQDLIDNKGKRYHVDDDFEITERGFIKWLPNRAPEAGAPCAIRYTHQPFWYVDDHGHQIRVTRATDPQTGKHSTVRMHTQLRLSREFVGLTAQQDPDTLHEPERQAPAAATLDFGPR